MTVLFSAVLLLVLFVVPGHLAVVVARGRRGPRGDAVASLFVAVLFSVLLTTGISHGLAAAGWFSAPALLALVSLVSLALVAVVIRRRLRVPPGRPDGAGWLLLGLGVALAFVYFPPAEYVFGDADEGIYANAAVQVNACGGLWFEDELLAGLPPDQRDCHIPFYLKGFYFGDLRARNPVVPHGFHFYTAFLAALVAVGGVSLGLAGPGLLTLLSVWAIYLLASRLAGRWVGLAVALLLGLSPLVVWFARITVAEVLCQTLLLGGGALLVVGWPSGPRTSPRGLSLLALVVAGLSLGAVHQVKIDFFLLPVAVMIFALLPGVREARGMPGFLAAYVASFALAVFFWFTTHSVYFHAQMRDLAAVVLGWAHRRTEASATVSGVMGAAYLGGLIGAGLLLRRFRTALGRWPWGRILAATAVLACAGALVLAVLPPVAFESPAEPLAEFAFPYHPEPVGPGRALEFRHGLQGLVSYVTLPGLLAGLGGVFLLLGRRDARPAFVLLALAVAQLAFILVANITIDRGSTYHFHGFRRHLSVTLPVLLLAATVPWFLPVSRPWRPWTRWAGVGLILVLGVHSIRIAWPHLLQRPWQNVRATLEQLARAAPPGAVWFASADDPLARRWQVPLRFLAGRRTFLVSRQFTGSTAVFDELLGNLARQGRAPVLLVGRSRAPWVAAVVAAVGREHARAVAVEEITVDEPPSHIPKAEDFVPWTYTLWVYGPASGVGPEPPGPPRPPR
ncbi:MAG: hypothetical protein JXQ29_15785 [Planctomycetes bacterium]|nr:hypothetical protein [Planctomycetota bacterium]